MLKIGMSTLQKQLKGVARSMYLSFSVLPRPLRAPMGLAYMLCRAADTFADGTSLPVAERRAFLSRYKGLFRHFPFDQPAGAEFCVDINGVQFTDVAQDQRLLQTLSACFDALNKLPLTDQALIGNVVVGVIKGMELDLTVFDDESSPRTLRTSTELERYLHFIGGEPGRFWSEMSLTHIPGLPVRQRESWIEHGIVFGTGLQMVNILRDLPADLKRGRCYIPEDLLVKHQLRIQDIAPEPAMAATDTTPPPSAPAPIPHLIEDKFRTLYVDMVKTARARLLRGVNYLDNIPGRYWGLRAAVAWPMLIGLETLKRLQEAATILNATQRVKMKRSEVYGLMAATAAMMPFQTWIERKARSIN
jgi:farnesyl-diphosphate farnesyltransferase